MPSGPPPPSPGHHPRDTNVSSAREARKAHGDLGVTTTSQETGHPAASPDSPQPGPRVWLHLVPKPQCCWGQTGPWVTADIYHGPGERAQAPVLGILCRKAKPSFQDRKSELGGKRLSRGGQAGAGQGCQPELQGLLPTSFLPPSAPGTRASGVSLHGHPAGAMKQGPTASSLPCCRGQAFLHSSPSRGT